MASGGFQRRIVKGIYAGASYTFTHYYTVYTEPGSEPTSAQTNGLVINVLYDFRNSVYYPTRGSKAILNWTTFPDAINDVKANKISAEYNQYIPFRGNKDVLALRGVGKFGLGAIAFE